MNMKVQKISSNVWKFTGTDNVNVYFVDMGENIVIDTGNRQDRHEILRFLGNLVDLKKVSKVIFTHLHYDHIGNFDIFPNAKFFASANEIKDFEGDRNDTVLNEDIVKKFSVKLEPLPEKIGPFEIIETPGHTRGSVCVWYPEKKILFSGDTLFPKKHIGRTDFPTSAPYKMNDTLLKLLKYEFKILAPGHEYD